MNYKKILQRATKERGNVHNIIGTLMVFNSEQIVEGIRRRWLFGKDINDGIIGTYSWKEYEMFKVSSNPRAEGNVDLTLTGALGRGLTVKKLSNSRYEIFSTDSKFDKISKQYGIEQFNLDERQKDELFDTLYYFALTEYLDNVWDV